MVPLTKNRYGTPIGNTLDSGRDLSTRCFRHYFYNVLNPITVFNERRGSNDIPSYIEDLGSCVSSFIEINFGLKVAIKRGYESSLDTIEIPEEAAKGLVALLEKERLNDRDIPKLFRFGNNAFFESFSNQFLDIFDIDHEKVKLNYMGPLNLLYNKLPSDKIHLTLAMALLDAQAILFAKQEYLGNAFFLGESATLEKEYLEVIEKMALTYRKEVLLKKFRETDWENPKDFFKLYDATGYHLWTERKQLRGVKWLKKSL